MERDPHPPEGGEQHNETTETPAEPIYEQLSDEQRIQRGVADALNEERPIDDATVRRIAEQLHGEPESLLSKLAASGALPNGLERALLEAVQDLPPERDSWIDALLDYADARGEDRGPREGWAEVTADDPEAAIEEARAAASRERRADRARLEHYVAAGLDPGDAEALIEYEHLTPEQRTQWAGTSTEPQGDAAAQEAAAGARDQERFDWFDGAAAGEDEADALVTDVPPPEHETTPRPAPRIYVADLAAYNNSRLHGIWLDAGRDVEELWADVQAMLAASPVPDAEEVAIHDHEDFTGYPLGEHEDLAFVSRLAKGIAEHGQAFAAYADWNRQEDPELARFGEHYEGTHPTREAWAEEVANEVFEWPRYREVIPEPLRGNVTLDLTSLALELEQHRHVVEGDEGVYVFNPDA
jgi:antirestriction protein